MLSSRVPLRAVVVSAVVAVAAGLLTTGAAHADPTAADLQQQLITARQDLNRLYAQAAAANERVNGATLALQQAEKALKHNRAVAKKADAAYEEQRAVVGAMTVEQQLNGSTDQAMLSLLQGGDPPQILEEASSLNAVDEAMTAELDRLDARQTVLSSASHAVEDEVDRQRTALADRKKARSQIDAAVHQAETLEKTMTAERDGMLQQIARLQGRSVDEVAAEQAKIDEQIDESGPGVGGGAIPDPNPTDPEPTNPQPTAPKPTTPQPTTPEPTQPPPPPPPPPSSSKVETAIAYAEAQLGEPYAWGGAGPSKWDCSGLAMRAWQAAGVNLSHYAPSQYTATKKVSVNSIQRGDLLYWSDGSASSIYHVAMYLGGGKMIHAPRPGRNVEIVSVSYWIKPDLASRPG